MFLTLLSFAFIITVLVFIHELGHYLVARINKVGVEVFSIGFGPELFGINDRYGTRWKFSLLPLGGYVKFVGDTNAASVKTTNTTENQLNQEESLRSFQNRCIHKSNKSINL